MNPSMSRHELHDRLIYITKGCRVIDRTETDWGEAIKMDRQSVENRLVYTKTEAKDCLGSKFDKWSNDPERWHQPTLEAAMRFADEAARGLHDDVSRRHEDTLIEMEIEALANENAILRSQLGTAFPNGIGGDGVLFAYERPYVPVFLPLNERYRKTLEERDELLKKISERPKRTDEPVQFELDVTSSSPDTARPVSRPPWETGVPPWVGNGKPPR